MPCLRFPIDRPDNLRAAVGRITDPLFTGLLENGSATVDLLERLCVPVPALTIGELLGVPADLYPDMFDAATAMFTFDSTSKESGRRLAEAVGWLTDTFVALIASKRATPGEDLISGWIRARDDDDALTEDELVSLAFLMMLAGLENAVLITASMIATLLCSDDAPATVAAWQAHRSELMERVAPSPFSIRRFAVADLTFGDVTIPQGDTVLLSLIGADSDPARNGRRSLMFGRGPHYCLGAQVTNLIIDAVVPELFVRFPKARLAIPEADLVYRESWRSHGLTSLPVILTP
ncbi:cytochrome P450 [Nocardia sp. NPDC049149]|uniref:cytochrome P450 n=1 Tax=Nocardia sp. NPDC049149 TaxID=3364315 RepID=UPI003722491F